MAGYFYEHETQVTLDTCGCTIARDSSLKGEDHRLSAVYARQCDAHAKTGATAVEVHQHNVSKNIAVGAVCEALGKDISAEILYAFDFKAGKIALQHPEIDAAVVFAVKQKLSSHPIANMALADTTETTAIFGDAAAAVDILG